MVDYFTQKQQITGRLRRSSKSREVSKATAVIDCCFLACSSSSSSRSHGSASTLIDIRARDVLAQHGNFRESLLIDIQIDDFEDDIAGVAEFAFHGDAIGKSKAALIEGEQPPRAVAKSLGHIPC